MSSNFSTSVHGHIRSINGVPVFASVPPSATFSTSSKQLGVRRANGNRPNCTRVIASATAVSSKSSQRQPRPENVDGDFYVDHTCIGELRQTLYLLVKVKNAGDGIALSFACIPHGTLQDCIP